MRPAAVVAISLLYVLRFVLADMTGSAYQGSSYCIGIERDCDIRIVIIDW